MSDNIITFPGHINAEKLQYQIEDIRAQLAENFEEVAKYYIAARDLESKSNVLQNRYDNLVLKLAADIGHENVPLGILEYCTNVIATVEGDGPDISLHISETVEEENDPALQALQQDVRITLDALSKYIQGITHELL